MSEDKTILLIHRVFVIQTDCVSVTWSDGTQHKEIRASAI